MSNDFKTVKNHVRKVCKTSQVTEQYFQRFENVLNVKMSCHDIVSTDKTFHIYGASVHISNANAIQLAFSEKLFNRYNGKTQLGLFDIKHFFVSLATEKYCQMTVTFFKGMRMERIRHL